jgi:hypothetical protein
LQYSLRSYYLYPWVYFCLSFWALDQRIIN